MRIFLLVRILLLASNNSFVRESKFFCSLIRILLLYDHHKITIFPSHLPIMFQIATLTHTIQINPSDFNSNIQSHIHQSLIKQVEGICLPTGYIVAVLSITEIGEANLQLSGEAEFIVNYKCLKLIIKKDDIVLAIVNETNKMGVFASVGPVTIFISNYQLPATFVAIKKGSVVRLKVLGVKVEKGQLFAIGTINEDYLGVISG